jgi:hypothetical protein
MATEETETPEREGAVRVRACGCACARVSGRARAPPIRASWNWEGNSTKLRGTLVRVAHGALQPVHAVAELVEQRHELAQPQQRRPIAGLDLPPAAGNAFLARLLRCISCR